MRIKPLRLQAGDKVAAVTLSWGGPGTFPYRYQAGKQQLEAAFGVTVIETPHALRDADWIAANPQARADDLMEAFADPSIRGIIATIGGDDSIRTLPYLDLEIIRQNPKVFMGFSDTTITHLACWKAGLGSFYGPSMMAGFGENGGLFPYLAEAVRRTLFSAEPLGVIHPNTDGWTVERLEWAEPANQSIKRRLTPSDGWRWSGGAAARRGRLLGGCLEVLDWLRGTDYWPPLTDWQDAILFIETSEEAPPPQYVERMVRVLGAMGVLQRLSGMLVGRPGGAMPVTQFAEYDAAIERVVREELGLHDLPIITRMDFGHTDPYFVLPYGALAEIDPLNQRFTILESAVT
ncbi:MAG: LD-carboxypeptidase [Anaerolineae bacterium]|nr:LD-carboxypeptidase [Anaerolineae bacterium]